MFALGISSPGLVAFILFFIDVYTCRPTEACRGTVETIIIGLGAMALAGFVAGWNLCPKLCTASIAIYVATASIIYARISMRARNYHRLEQQ